MNMTLEERERHAYITNSSDHPLIVAALEAEHDEMDEMRHERDMAKEEVSASDDRVVELEQELERTAVERDELREQLEAAGLDLV